MPSKTWGKPQLIQEYIVVGEHEEIETGQKAYVFNRDDKDHSVIGVPTWEAFLNGDISFVKDQIEANIPHTKVVWLRISWTKAERKHHYPEYWVYGFEVHAIVENTGGASLTGFEIIGILIGIAFLVGVVYLCLTGGWLTWKIMKAVEDVFGSGGVAVIGMVIFIIIIFSLLLLLGVKFSGKGFKAGR